MPESMSAEHIFLKICQNRCQKERQKECQSICHKECQILRSIYASRCYVRKYVRIIVRVGISRSKIILIILTWMYIQEFSVAREATFAGCFQPSASLCKDQDLAASMATRCQLELTVLMGGTREDVMGTTKWLHRLHLLQGAHCFDFPSSSSSHRSFSSSGCHRNGSSAINGASSLIVGIDFAYHAPRKMLRVKFGVLWGLRVVSVRLDFPDFTVRLKGQFVPDDPLILWEILR